MINGNEPAFASGVTCNENGIYTGADATGGGNGLTKREYFAAMAMQGLLAGHYEYFKGNDDVSVPNSIAEYAVRNADALINELNKPTTP